MEIVRNVSMLFLGMENTISGMTFTADSYPPTYRNLYSQLIPNDFLQRRISVPNLPK